MAQTASNKSAYGTPGGTRTPDLDVRTVLLYPAELLGRTIGKRRFIDACRMVRDTGVEPVSKVWKTFILTAIRIPPTLKLRRAGPPVML